MTDAEFATTARTLQDFAAARGFTVPAFRLRPGPRTLRRPADAIVVGVPPDATVDDLIDGLAAAQDDPLKAGMVHGLLHQPVDA